jgi:hypothetical protein
MFRSHPKKLMVFSFYHGTSIGAFSPKAFYAISNKLNYSNLTHPKSSVALKTARVQKRM